MPGRHDVENNPRMDRVPVEVWAIAAIAFVLAVVRIRVGIDRRRAAAGADRFQHWGHHLTVGLLLGGAGTAWITASFERPVAVSWLVAINVVTVAFYGWDKLVSKLAVARVPENTLHLLALAGGSIGALLAQGAFRHKTSKFGFQLRFWGVVTLQLVLIAVVVRTQSTPS